MKYSTLISINLSVNNPEISYILQDNVMCTNFYTNPRITTSCIPKLVYSIAIIFIFVPDLALASDSSAELINAILPNFLSGLCGAIIGAMASYKVVLKQAKLARNNELKLMVDKYKLSRINDQISKFYAPLLTISKSAQALWGKFCDEKGRSKSSPLDFFIKDAKDEPIEVSGEILFDYIRVMKEVFLPLNKQRMDIILSEAALIDHAHKIPDYLIDLVNHVSELNAMMKRWETITDARHAMSFVGNSKEPPELKYAVFYPSCKFPMELNKELEKKHAHLIYQKNTLLDAWNQKEKRD